MAPALNRIVSRVLSPLLMLMPMSFLLLLLMMLLMTLLMMLLMMMLMMLSLFSLMVGLTSLLQLSVWRGKAVTLAAGTSSVVHAANAVAGLSQTR
jgi:hypothetical protein